VRLNRVAIDALGAVRIEAGHRRAKIRQVRPKPLFQVAWVIAAGLESPPRPSTVGPTSRLFTLLIARWAEYGGTGRGRRSTGTLPMGRRTLT
jgi:hypothetical protein